MTMQQNLLKPFNGVFDVSTCEEFREKRLALGISLKQLGEFLRIHWTTVRKWETGLTASCHPCHISSIASFLNGDYDEALRQRYGFEPLEPQDEDQLEDDAKSSVIPPRVKYILRLEFQEFLLQVISKYLEDLFRNPIPADNDREKELQ